MNLARAHTLDCPLQAEIEALIKEAQEKQAGSPCYSADEPTSLLDVS